MKSLKQFLNEFSIFTESHSKFMKRLIFDFFLMNGLKINKISRARLNDGYYIYHEFGIELKGYKSPKIIEETKYSITKQTQPYEIRRDFLLEDNIEALEWIVLEALQRAGKKAKLKVNLSDIFSNIK